MRGSGWAILIDRQRLDAAITSSPGFSSRDSLQQKDNCASGAELTAEVRCDQSMTLVFVTSTQRSLKMAFSTQVSNRC